jgi:hypothetical protein
VAAAGQGTGAAAGPGTVAAANARPAASTGPTTQTTPANLVAPTPGSSGLVTWRDPQGRFSIGAPPDWPTLDAPPAMFGTGVVGFRDRGGLADLTVAVDTATRAVSPELYAASMELAMQQVPGYALDGVQPGTTGGNPSVRRVFSQTRQDPSGRDYTAHGLQVAIVRGATAYVVAAFAPADQYPQFSPTFERMLDSLAFG